MQSQEQPESAIEPMELADVHSPVESAKGTGGHGINPTPDPWPDPAGDIDRPRRDNAFPQEVSADA